MLVCTIPAHRDPPTPRGFSVDGQQWQCDLDRYRGFVDAVTDHRIPEDPTEADCYLVRTRLEGFIEQHRADGKWTNELPPEYPDVESLAEIEALARFFRECTCKSPSPE